MERQVVERVQVMITEARDGHTRATQQMLQEVREDRGSLRQQHGCPRGSEITGRTTTPAARLEARLEEALEAMARLVTAAGANLPHRVDRPPQRADRPPQRARELRYL